MQHALFHNRAFLSILMGVLLKKVTQQLLYIFAPGVVLPSLSLQCISLIVPRWKLFSRGRKTVGDFLVPLPVLETFFKHAFSGQPAGVLAE